IEDQASYAKLVRNILEALELTEGPAEGSREESETESDEDREAEGLAQEEQSQDEAKPVEAQSEEVNIDEGREQEDLAQLGEAALEPSDQEGEQQPYAPPRRPNISVLDEPERFGYKVFTRQFDEIVSAEQLCD